MGVYASGPGFSGYSSGILQNGCNPNPNHEVYAYGWGSGYFSCMNSWGADWGENGGFKLATCSVTDWTIVGSIRADIANMPFPFSSSTVPGSGSGGGSGSG